MDIGYLSQETYDKIEVFCERWPRAKFGPGHLVFGDNNVDDYRMCFCLRLAKGALFHKAGLSEVWQDFPSLEHERDLETLKAHDWYDDYDEGELAATVKFLEELLEVPEDERQHHVPDVCG